MASENTAIVSQLNSIIDAQTSKYSYFLARYLNDASIDLNSELEYNYFSNYSFDLKDREDLLMSAYTNVIKSVIDTLTSKIAAQKPRPVFNPVNGLYKTRQIVKSIQTYFDNVYEKCNIHEIMVDAFRDACIFGKGYAFVNPITYKITSLKPHTVAYLNSESKYDAPKRLLIKYRTFPSNRLKDYGLEAPNKSQYVTLWHYIDVDKHQQELFINAKSVKVMKYDADILPIVELYYNKPVFGGNTAPSIVQELDGIQTQIDVINAKISACAQLSPANTTYVIEGSNLTVNDIDSRTGKVFGVRMPPGTNTPPVVNVAPPVFDNQWLNLLEYYVKQAYEITGVSQLSAQSKKPSGVDSGIALQTIVDVESDRLETAMNHYIQSYTDLARLIIDILPDNEEILPQSMNTSTMKWKDVKSQIDLFKVQFSSATWLSTNPSEKIKQIMQYSQIGLIPQNQIAKYMDLPDLNDINSGLSAAIDGVEQCIQRAIEYEEYDIPEFVNYKDLAQAIAKEENRLYAAISDDKKNNEQVEESLKRLMILEQYLLTTMNENGFVDLNGGAEEEETQVSEAGLGSGVGSTDIADITETLTQQEGQDMVENAAINNDEQLEQEELANPQRV